MAKQAKFEPTKVKDRALPWRVNVPPLFSETGARERRFFKTKSEAETFIDQTRIRIRNNGSTTHGLSSVQREVAASAFRLLNGQSPSLLLEIVKDYLDRKAEHEKSVTFAELKEKFLNQKFSSAKRRRSEAYRRQLNITFRRLSKLDGLKVSTLVSKQVDDEIGDAPPQARNAHLRIAKALFNFAIQNDWMKSNPVKSQDFAEIAPGEVEVLSNTETLKLLLECKREDVELLPYHLFGLFAGIRPQELERMHWDHVRIEDTHILLPGNVTKTKKRRVIELEETLRNWLEWFNAEGGKQTGPITPSANLRRRLRSIRIKAGIEHWIPDVMRHTYASNWLAVHESADRLRANLGHHSGDVLWKHYHKATIKAEAQKFWSILPSTEKLTQG